MEIPRLVSGKLHLRLASTEVSIPRFLSPLQFRPPFILVAPVMYTYRRSVFRGEDDIPLSYLIREKPEVRPEADDPASNHAGWYLEREIGVELQWNGEN